MTLLMTILLLASAGLTAWVGWQLRANNRLEWLLGYSPTAVRDRSGLARWAGGVLFVLALIEIVSAAGLWVWPVLLAGLICAALHCLGLIVLALGATQYSKMEETF